MRRFGTHPSYIKALQNLYHDSSSQILNNGYISQPFPILQGTRQGCPLSPLLFAMAIEPLAIRLRAENAFRGISIGSREVKLSLFADDMLLFIAKPEESVPAIVSILDRFSKFAGFRVNYTKSNLLPLSVDKSYFTSRPELTNFAISSKPLKYLGVHVPSTLSTLYQINLQPVVKAIARTLENWKDLPLSLSGRVAVIKSVLFPKLSYIFQMLPLYPSRGDVMLLRRLFSTFVWHGKHPRVAYDKLLLPKALGGYGLPDLVTFTQSAHFRHIADWLLQRSEYSNFELETALLAPYSLSALLHAPKTNIPARIASGVLFAGTYKAWIHLNKCLQLEYTYTPYTTFWGNPKFQPAMDDANFLRWREKGISAVRDVFDPGGTLLSFMQLQSTYGLPSRDFYMYLQARHFIQADLLVKDSGFSKNVVCDILSLLVLKPYKIQFLYNPLLEPLKDTLWKGSLQRWERDIPEISSAEIWLQHCGSILRWLPSAAMQETHLKFIQRAYISPAQRKHMVVD